MTTGTQSSGYPCKNAGYSGREAKSSSVRPRSRLQIGGWVERLQDIATTSRMSSSVMPRMVTAGVPMRTPEAIVGGPRRRAPCFG